MTARIITADCRDAMREMDADSIDAIVCDPPYGLSFMGQGWDHGVPGAEFWTAALHVAKPGAYMVAAGGQRTHHRLMVAIEDAGWEIRDVLMHIFGSGFPKSHNVSAALRAMPACSCRVAKVGCEPRTIDTGQPSSFVGASIGTETTSVPIAICAADDANGPCFEPSSGPSWRSRQVESGVEVFGGQFDPEMFRPASVAGIADSDEISRCISVIKPQPETLRDNVVTNERMDGSAVDATSIASDNLLRNDPPFFTLVSPSSVPPSGISRSTKSGAIVNGHADAGTVNGLGNFARNNDSASLAGERIHRRNHTAERCEKCDGIIQESITDGLGSALKPAYEPWILCRKPLSEKNLAANVLKHGTGALNIDGCRIQTEESLNGGAYSENRKPSDSEWVKHGGTIHNSTGRDYEQPLGRWPANVIHDGSDEVLALFPESGNGSGMPTVTTRPRDAGWCNSSPGGGVAAIDNFGDTGSAARFFYTAKASKGDRDDGLHHRTARQRDAKFGSVQDGRPHTPEGYEYHREPRGNHHPTVKPVDLMRYLCRLITPPGGTILDPFTGSGSTGKAALLEGFNFVGIELDPEYAAIARDRVYAAAPLFAAEVA